MSKRAMLRATNRETAVVKVNQEYPKAIVLEELHADAVDRFLDAYIEAALWSTSDESGGVPLDKNYSKDDLAPETLLAMRDDCEKFLGALYSLIVTDGSRLKNGANPIAYAGHDFWLTRNGHGAGFCDGDWTKAAGETLSRASKAFGEVHLYVDDDGKVHGE